jgi:hypothetical protein
MSYTIRLHFQPANINSTFGVTDRAVWHYANGGTWTDNGEGVFILTMGGSGTSGMLRLQQQDGSEPFTVVVGVHNYEPWCHILPDVGNETAAALIAQYYRPGQYSGIPVVPTWKVQNQAHRDLSVVVRKSEDRTYDAYLSLS